jgi:hypothetical protein
MPAAMPRDAPPRVWAAAFGLYAAGFVVLAWPWISGAVTIPYDDKSNFFTALSFMAASFAKGQSPFWNPYVFAGWPQIADPQSLLFSPLHLLLALCTSAPTFWQSDMTIYAYLFLGGLAVMLLARDRGWHPAAAMVAGLTFAFGGSAAARLQHTGQVMSLVYVALALWLVARTLDRASWRAGLAAGIACGLLAVQRDQVAMLGLYLLAGYVLWFWCSGDGAIVRVRATLLPLLVCGVTAACLAVVPLTLTALLAEDSNRPEIAFRLAGEGSLHPAHLLMWAFADLFGADNWALEFWGPPSPAWGAAFGGNDIFLSQNMGEVYAGALALVTIAGFGLLRGLAWSREVRFFTVALAVLLLYALGWNTPAFRIMYDLVPGVTLFRRPADATFIIGLLVAILTGYLLHRWLTATVPPPRRRQRVAEIAVAVVLVVVAVALAARVGEARTAFTPIVIGAAFAAGVIAVLALARRFDGRWPFAVAVLLAAFVSGDLAWNNGPGESTGVPPSWYDALRHDTHNETVALLRTRLAADAAAGRRDRVEMIGIGYHWPNLGMVHGFEHLFGHNPLRLRDFERVTGAEDTVAEPGQRHFTPAFPSYRSTFADMFGVRLIALGVPVEQVDPKLRPGDLDFIARTKDAYVYENPRALPRVMVVPRYRVADFDAIVRDGWPDVDPRSAVLLAHAPEGMPPAPGVGAGGTARIVRYANTEVVIDADAPGGGFLVLNDIWQPWWRATIDGKPARILKANVLFRAVALTPGQHRVRFVFRPLLGAWEQVRAKLLGEPASARVAP